jgi:MoxR-like ATPase
MTAHIDFMNLRTKMQEVIVGQDALLDRLLIALLTGGHILLEGPPGLAKTTAVNTLARGVHGSFQRIQFTPDLMPGDLTGSDIYDPHDGKFRFVEGPIFHEIVLADEINRAPPKVQSALLEAMGEHQVTVGGTTRRLPDLFIVMATQNPLEQMGTYPLPEAQLDRFLLHVNLTYPSQEEELEILRRDHRRHHGQDPVALETGLHPEQVMAARRLIAEIHIEDMLERYIVLLVSATRELGTWKPEWREYIRIGASPRASIALLHSASALAFLRGRDYVIPEDVQEIAPDVLRHRIIPGYSARAENVTVDQIVQYLLETIPVP